MGDNNLETGLKAFDISSKPSGESAFLVPFFNFFYYFRLLPFRITLDQDSNLYQLWSCRWHKILCGFAHFVVLVMHLLTSIMFLLNMGDKEPSIIFAFEVTSNLSVVVATALIMNILWRHQQDFLQIIEYTRVNQPVVGKWRLNIVGIWIYGSLFFIFIFMIAANYIFIEDKSHGHSFPVSWNDKPANDTILQNTQNNTGNTLSKVKVLILFLVTYKSTFYLTIQGILLVLSLSLRQLGKEFAAEMEKIKVIPDFGKGEALEKGIQCYREFKVVCDEIRRVYGSLLMTYYIDCVSYYAEAPHVLLGKRGHLEFFVLIYYVVSGVVWFLAAEFHHNVRKTIHNWISLYTTNKTLILENRLMMFAFSNEINFDPIALSCKYFRVTYGHIGRMSGLVLTYAIIVCQLHHESYN